MSSTTATSTTNINGNDQANLPYGRLESNHFGTYDIWQEKTVVGKKTQRQEVDVNMGMIIVLLIENKNHFVFQVQHPSSLEYILKLYY